MIDSFKDLHNTVNEIYAFNKSTSLYDVGNQVYKSMTTRFFEEEAKHAPRVIKQIIRDAQKRVYGGESEWLMALIHDKSLQPLAHP